MLFFKSGWIFLHQFCLTDLEKNVRDKWSLVIGNCCSIVLLTNCAFAVGDTLICYKLFTGSLNLFSWRRFCAILIFLFLRFFWTLSVELFWVTLFLQLELHLTFFFRSCPFACILLIAALITCRNLCVLRFNYFPSFNISVIWIFLSFLPSRCFW